MYDSKLGPVTAALATAALKATPLETKQFGDLAAGPYDRLVIHNAMVIPGHGGPPTGPYGIVIENDRLMEEVARMVAESKRNAPPTNEESEPFVVTPTTGTSRQR